MYPYPSWGCRTLVTTSSTATLKGDTPMRQALKTIVHYSRYAMTVLATVAFGLSQN